MPENTIKQIVIDKLIKLTIDLSRVAEMRESNRSIPDRTWADEIFKGEISQNPELASEQIVGHFRYALFIRLSIADLNILIKNIAGADSNTESIKTVLNNFLVKLNWGKHMMEKYLVEAEDCLHFVIKDVENVIKLLEQ